MRCTSLVAYKTHDSNGRMVAHFAQCARTREQHEDDHGRSHIVHLANGATYTFPLSTIERDELARRLAKATGQ